MVAYHCKASVSRPLPARSTGRAASAKLAAKVGKSLEGIAAVLRVGVQHGKPAVKFGLLGCRQRYRVMVDAVPNLADEVKPLLGRKVAEIQCGHGKIPFPGLNIAR